MDTEIRLRDWRLRPTTSERLCVGILTRNGYADVDPQAPLGGPDGKKDIVAWLDARKYITVCYFPTTPVTFSQIIRKYKVDYKG